MQGSPESALQLIGAATALREEIGAPRPPAYASQLEKALMPARLALGEDVAIAAEQAGKAFSQEQAIEMALSENSNGG